MQKRLHLLIAMMVLLVSQAMAQITTSGVNGKVTANGEDVIGATVTATHQPSGTIYRAVTNIDGRYTIQGMRPGGPYKVEISYVGYEPKTFEKIQLSLGESTNLSCKLQEDAQVLQDVVVTGKAGLAASRTGAATSMNAQQINDMPSITHGIADVARLNPQLTVTNSGTMSFAGTNNRYNNFMIDGAANNDVFGLASNGSNGGQAGTQPVSMETIEQIQISVAPFDVRQSGFTGGAINAITKSGTNQFHGSAYFYGYNQNLIGTKYPYSDGTGYAPKYQKQNEYNAGVTLGGPIIKNKLFFFANYEHTNKQYPNLYGLGSSYSAVDQAQATDILKMVKDIAAKQGLDYNYNYDSKDIYTKSDKAGLKLDWNINEFNKFAIRWSMVSAEQLSGTGSRTSLNAETYSYPFKSTTHSFIAELQSRFSPAVSNEARASFVRVRDNRDIIGRTPMISISGVGGGSVNLGNERNSMANYLNQDIWTVEDNLTWLRGNHTFIFGTHNEIYHFKNMFLSDLFGSYTFKGYDNFKAYYDDYMNDRLDPTKSYMNQYRYGHANVDVTGTTNWASEFSAGQFGIYAQDKWAATNNFTLTYGLRLDIPVFFDTPMENKDFNDWAAKHNYDLKTNRSLSFAPMVSPRVGFRWDINNDRRFILRGGAGVFTGRIPFVWVSNNFSGTGVQISSYDSNYSNTKGLELILDPNKQESNAQKLGAITGNQDVAVCSKNFKFAQNLRLNLGFDFDLLGINWTAEAIYSKTLNDIIYKNLAKEQSGETFSQKYGYEWDNRPLYQDFKLTYDKDGKTTNMPAAYVLENTNKGYGYSANLTINTTPVQGLNIMAAYTHTVSKELTGMPGSNASSVLNYMATVNGPNDPGLHNSQYVTPDRFVASLTHSDKSGNHYSFIYETWRGGYNYSYMTVNDINGDGYNYDAIYVPTDAEVANKEFRFVSDDDRDRFMDYVHNDKYLSKRQGKYAEAYSVYSPWVHRVDFSYKHDFKVNVGKSVNTLQLSLDVKNILNLFNSSWGVSKYMNPALGEGRILRYEGVDNEGYATFSTAKAYNANTETFVPYHTIGQCWYASIGIKYMFN